MTRRHEYTVKLRVDELDPKRDQQNIANTIGVLLTDHLWVGRNIEIEVPDPVDITPKSPADLAEEAIRRARAGFGANRHTDNLVRAVRGALEAK